MSLPATARVSVAAAIVAIVLALAPVAAWAAQSDSGSTLQAASSASLQGSVGALADKGAAQASIKGDKLVLSKKTFAYNGKVQKPKVRTIGGKSLVEGTDYTLRFSAASPKAVGTYSVKAVGKGSYAGTSAKATFKIVKAANPMIVKARKSSYTIRYASVKGASQTIKKSKLFGVSKAQGKVTFKKKSGNSKITITKSGDVIVARGARAETFSVKALVRAAGNKNYKPATKVVTFKIRLRGDIKGNISYTTGEKIYHVPGDRYYDSTVINEDEGERWFATEQQARRAGWRHSKV